MKKNDEFYIGYIENVGDETKKSLKKFVLLALAALVLGAFLFSFLQRPAKSSAYDFGNPTQIVGVYHESPYPMLRIKLTQNEYKEVVLLGFGKIGANPYLDAIREKEGDLSGKQLTIEGQLVYYNGKTLLEIDDSQKIKVTGRGKAPKQTSMGQMTLKGEITDPKCYFGVMKPGYGKIHRSCAALCIAGGIPPVLVSNDENGTENYFLLTDLKGNKVNTDLLPYIGQPSMFSGQVSKIGDWNILKIDVDKIEKRNEESTIY